MTRKLPGEPVKHVPSYNGLNDTRDGRFRLRNLRTGQMCVTEGCCLAVAINALRWDASMTGWVHLGTSHADKIRIYWISGYKPEHLHKIIVNERGGV